MFGADILVRTLSTPVATGKTGECWQYHPRSDRHSKAACWGILFDLMRTSSLLRDHVTDGLVKFGINHEMTDFKQNRKKNLDLVICTPATHPIHRPKSFSGLAERYKLELSPEEQDALTALPPLFEAHVGMVRVALEAKACMTAHSKARPRLFDELNSSHQTIYGSGDQIVAAGFVMVNTATEFVSPGRVGYCPNCGHRVSPVNPHKQPGDAKQIVEKVRELPRRSSAKDQGFDALAIVAINCRNDGTPVALVKGDPAPKLGDSFHYDSMIVRLAQTYDSRFSIK